MTETSNYEKRKRNKTMSVDQKLGKKKSDFFNYLWKNNNNKKNLAIFSFLHPFLSIHLKYCSSWKNNSKDSVCINLIFCLACYLYISVNWR